MKKQLFLLAIGLGLTVSSFAQKAKINEAAKALKTAQDLLSVNQSAGATAPLRDAKSAIDAAVLDPSTSSNAKAWYTKAAIYMSMQEVADLNSANPYNDALAALKKAAELDKKITSEEQYPSIMANGAFYSYNDGVTAMNASEYSKSYQLFKQTVDLLGTEGGKYYKGNLQVDTIAARAKLFEGYSAFYDNKFDVAVPILKESAINKITANESNVYLLLSQAYEKLKNPKEQLAIIEEGKKKFPNDKNITNAELNYYINSGKQDEMLAKLEDAISKDPNNSVLPFNLGIVYRDMAKVDKAPTPQTDEYFQKAATAYKKALSLDPNRLAYLYELGALYYNKAGYYNNAMMALTGTDKASIDKAKELKSKRDEYFNAAIEYLEKARTQFKAKKSSLTDSEMRDYSNTLSALNSIYVNLDQEDKATAVSSELNGL